MNKKIISWMIEWSSRYTSVGEDIIPVMRYGIEVVLNSFVKILLLLFIGIICGSFIETIVVIMTFGILRKFAGGVHCKTDVGCFLTMFLICQGSIGVSRIGDSVSIFFMIIGLIFIWFSILKYAPCNSKVNPIIDDSILWKKRKGAIALIVGCNILIIVIPLAAWKWLIFCPIFIEALTILPFAERRGVT